MSNDTSPIDMVLFCPNCGLQHIDRKEKEWNNPPHRSHLCAGCKHVWRPADVFTNGVYNIRTLGMNDSPPINREVRATIIPRPLIAGVIFTWSFLVATVFFCLGVIAAG